jgi:hypothetical protein
MLHSKAWLTDHCATAPPLRSRERGTELVMLDLCAGTITDKA